MLIRVYQAVQQVLQAVQQVHDHSHVAKLGSYKNSKLCSCKCPCVSWYLSLPMD